MHFPLSILFTLQSQLSNLNSSLSTLQSQLCIRVVMRKYLGIIISLLRHIFRTVLRQTNTVSVSDGVKRNTVLGGCDGEIRGLQAKQRPHCGSLDGHAAELYGFHTDCAV